MFAPIDDKSVLLLLAAWVYGWNLGMDNSIHPTLYWACDYLSILIPGYQKGVRDSLS